MERLHWLNKFGETGREMERTYLSKVVRVHLQAHDPIDTSMALRNVTWMLRDIVLDKVAKDKSYVYTVLVPRLI